MCRNSDLDSILKEVESDEVTNELKEKIDNAFNDTKFIEILYKFGACQDDLKLVFKSQKYPEQSAYSSWCWKNGVWVRC